MARARLPEKSVWIEETYKRFRFLLQQAFYNSPKELEEWNEWSTETFYTLSLLYDAAVSGQEIYRRLCLWRQSGSKQGTPLFVEVLAQDVYGYFVQLMHRWWFFEAQPEASILKNLPPLQIWHEPVPIRPKRWNWGGSFWHLELVYFVQSSYAWDMRSLEWDFIPQMLSGFVEVEEEQQAWYDCRDVRAVCPSHGVYLARMLAHWLRVYGQYREAVEAVWHSYRGRWSWLYWYRMLVGYVYLLGATYRLGCGLAGLVWHKRKEARERPQRPSDLRAEFEEWELITEEKVDEVLKDPKNHCGAIALPGRIVHLLGWLWDICSGLWGGWLVDVGYIEGLIFHRWVEIGQLAYEYCSVGRQCRERYLLEGHLDAECGQRLTGDRPRWKFDSLSVSTYAHTSMTGEESLTFGAALLWLVEEIEEADWGCVGWHEEESGTPVEAWGWKRRQKYCGEGLVFSDRSWDLFGRYHGVVVRKLLRYEECLRVLCRAARRGEIVFSLIELYGMTLELLGDAYLLGNWALS